MLITKSDFLKYIECPSYFWFWKRKPEILAPEKINPFVDRLKDQGALVEVFARNLYPDARFISGAPAEASTLTADHIKDGATALLQASFLVDGLFAACDILIWNELFQGWDIIEVKSRIA